MTSQRVLTALLEGLPDPAFAVLDGAAFEDLPAQLSCCGLSGRPLLRDMPGSTVQREGPWLIPVGPPPERSALFAVMAAAPGQAGVIWATVADADALYGHLRSLNQVRMPSGERVLFRQADPNVMNALLPLLDAPQAARMLGPASALVFESAEAGGGRRVQWPGGLPTPSQGELAFTQDQIAVLNVRQRDLSVAAYLREVAEEELAGVPQDMMLGFVRRARASGETLGVVNESGIKRWAYLLIMTDGRIEWVKEARAYIMRGEEAPDRQLEKLIGHTARALREGTTVPSLDTLAKGDLAPWPALILKLGSVEQETDDEEEPVQRRADHRHPEGAAGWAAGG